MHAYCLNKVLKVLTIPVLMVSCSREQPPAASNFPATSDSIEAIIVPVLKSAHLKDTASKYPQYYYWGYSQNARWSAKEPILILE